jgi:hypothetical protein
MTETAFLVGYVFEDVVITMALFFTAYTLMNSINGLITLKFAKILK